MTTLDKVSTGELAIIVAVDLSTAKIPLTQITPVRVRLKALKSDLFVFENLLMLRGLGCVRFLVGVVCGPVQNLYDFLLA